MLSDFAIRAYIGEQKFNEYISNSALTDMSLALATYEFDIQLRGLLMSALGVLEVGLCAQLIQTGNSATFSSFGHARKVLAHSGKATRETISRNLGARNYKALRGALQNLNHLRNRVAHHERVWNHRNPFAFPELGLKQSGSAAPLKTNRHTLAWSLIGIGHILSAYPPLIEFEKLLEELLTKTPIDRGFLLRSMGFEVP